MQPEDYRYDYTAVEQRLRQLEAPAYRDRLVGRGVLVLAIAAAICGVLLSAGYAWHLAKDPKVVEKVVERIVEVPAPAPAPAFPQVPETASEGPGVVTTNFTLFRETEVEIDGQVYSVDAGHKYLTETDTVFATAWCYTNRTIDGVDIRINLGVLDPGSRATRSPVAPRTLTETGLTQADHVVLFESRPWLSGNPNVDGADLEARGATPEIQGKPSIF